MEDDIEKLKKRYLNFAKYEAKGRCQAYFDLARWVTESDILLQFISNFHDNKRQPNLIFAAVRKVYGVPNSLHEFERIIHENREAITQVVNTKITQTNEPARCGALFLALSQMKQEKIALIEVGASAGLCMIPDYYQYSFDGTKIVPNSASGQSPLITCGFDGPMPEINKNLNIVWRKGIDLNPIDLSDKESCDWLETLVWPGQTDRLHRLQTAIAEARQHRLEITGGNLLDHLEASISAAPKEADIVIYHSAVMNYMPPKEVKRFRALMNDLPVNWILQEHSLIFPDLLDPALEVPRGRFVLSYNNNILAHTHPHGEDIVWFAKGV
ncbi:MAG: DUF2332 domain-containing protein [Parvularculales bacterium]